MATYRCSSKVGEKIEVHLETSDPRKLLNHQQSLNEKEISEHDLLILSQSGEGLIRRFLHLRDAVIDPETETVALANIDAKERAN